ncbi:MAG: putative signal transducing protein [Planctomycetota bacterium]|jgi:hypothetical protein
MSSNADDPKEHPELVEFHQARNPWEAQIILAIMEDAGIPAFIPGGLLTDEFAMSQQLMNLTAVKIRVPADRLEDAQAALAAAREAGEMLNEDSDTGEGEED